MADNHVLKELRLLQITIRFLALSNSEKVESNPKPLENSYQITYNKSTCGSNSVVECLLPKQKVASSNLVSRSNF
jgi:hypothetical protein